MLTEKTKKVVEEMNNLMGDMFKTFGFDGLSDMDDEESMMLIRCLKLMSMSTDLMIDQAKLLDSMNDKLDTLVKERA